MPRGGTRGRSPSQRPSKQLFQAAMVLGEMRRRGKGAHFEREWDGFDYAEEQDPGHERAACGNARGGRVGVAEPDGCRSGWCVRGGLAEAWSVEMKQLR